MYNLSLNAIYGGASGAIFAMVFLNSTSSVFVSYNIWQLVHRRLQKYSKSHFSHTIKMLYRQNTVFWMTETGPYMHVVSFPADFSPSVGKSTSGKLPIAFQFAVFQSLLASRIHCLRHVVHCTLTAMQSYVTSHVKLK